MTWEIVFWLALFALFIIVEANTVSLYCVWFALGSLIALIPAITGGPFWLQLIVFAVISAGTLALFRPLFKQYIRNKKDICTNSDRNIGETAVCTERIDNVTGHGAVKLLGKEWTARSSDGSVVEEGDKVRVESISGVKLIVSPLSVPQSVPETAPEPIPEPIIAQDAPKADEETALPAAALTTTNIISGG
jgi:membrane protein implicated in regulation of membrane protease activity